MLLISLKLLIFQQLCSKLALGSISPNMKAIWWLSVILLSTSLCGKFSMVDLRVRLRFSGLTLWLSKQTTLIMNLGHLMSCFLDNHFSLEKLIRSQGSTLCGKQLQILLAGRLHSIGIRDTVSVSISGISSSDMENPNPLGSHLKISQNNPQSIPGARGNEGEVSSKCNETHGLELLNQIKLPGLYPSMSVGDLVKHIGDCISEQMRSHNPNVSVNEAQKWEILDEISQYLLNDNQTLANSDEKSIMSRANSLCCFLQKEDTRAQNLQVSTQNVLDLALGYIPEDSGPTNHSCENLKPHIDHALGNDIELGGNSQQGASMSRNDSVSELLLHLPRIASLPQFLIP